MYDILDIVASIADKDTVSFSGINKPFSSNASVNDIIMQEETKNTKEKTLVGLFVFM